MYPLHMIVQYAPVIHCRLLLFCYCDVAHIMIVLCAAQIIMKSAAEESLKMRVRRCWLASALVAFSQGVVFFHAGDEILRSKSLDRDSYNSGKPSCLWLPQLSHWRTGMRIRLQQACS